METLKTQGFSNFTPQREIIRIKASADAMPQKLRVAGYARVSSDSADQLNSFSAQVNYYQKLIEKNSDWQLAEIYADEAVSGVSIEKREDFNRMLSDCRKGKIDRIITKSTSRFARNTLDGIGVLRELKAMGVTVYFEKEGIDTAKTTGENLLTLYSLFAQEESISISQNCKKGNRMRMQSGTYVSSSTPYGYRLVDKQLQIYDSEAKIVRRIFAEYLDGSSTTCIAQGLMADEIPTKDGRITWRPQSISIILKNERYVGDMLLQKTYSEDALPYRKQKNKGELPKYYVKNTHEPIVEQIQFELANILLKERSTYICSQHGEYPLSRKIKCSECGTTYRRKETNTAIYWVCRTHDRNKADCTSQRITQDAVYGAFIRMYNKLKQNYSVILLPMLDQLEKLQMAQQRNNPQLNTLNKQIAELSEQNHVMTGLLSSGILDSALFISQTDELNRKIRALKLAKARLLEENQADGLTDKTEDLIELLENGPACISEMNENLLADMVEKIIAHDTESINFILTNGLGLTERL
ncbi:MAG: recombinase family protein [Oscillospiraceae bacterium]|nr:recombinase family protein [Oscillospiraceae bacterium]